MKILISTFIIVTISFIAKAQNTFQKFYDAGADAECFGAYQLADGGYLFTGIINSGNYKVFMARTDCDGDVVWCRAFNNSSTVGNISQRAIPTYDGGFVLAASVGSFNAYNILIAKTDGSGNVIWQKIMQGTGDDLVNSIIETSKHDLVIAGKTNSFGQDAGSPYCDVYIAKLDEYGNYLWGKSYGTYHNIDEAFDIVQTPDSGYAATGRYIDQGTFYAFLLKTDQNGNVNFLKAYGDTNQYSCGYGLLSLPGGGFALCGATTVMKANFQSYADEFLITTDAAGDTAWCRSYHGTNPDHSENASSIISTTNGYALAVATMSYPTTGFVPNKHLILNTDFNGNLLLARTYNNGGSHYPYITKPFDGIGILISGFTTNYSSYFSPIMIRTDNNFNSGCNETDRLATTVTEYPPFRISTPALVMATGGSVINSTVNSLITLVDSAICENIVDTCNLTAGLSTVDDDQLEVYFDQQNTTVEIRGTVPAVTLSIYDYAGRLVRNEKIITPGYSSIAELSSGLYVVVITTATIQLKQKVFKR